MFPILETERLTLREITESDSQEIYRCFSNDDLTRFYGQDSFESIEQAREIIEKFAENYKERRAIRWGIERKGIPGLIGTIGYHAYLPKNRRAEIGYELHPDHWHQGYMTEALKEILAFGFNELGLTRIGAVVFTENVPSSQVLKKAGFAEEGILRKYMYQNGVPHDTYMYSLIK